MNRASSPLRFCTTLDSAFLPRGLALYRSLEVHASPFHLYVLAMDDEAATIIEELRLPHASSIDVEDIESGDPDLHSAKVDRTTSEYCWTIKPSLCRYLLERLAPDETLTYLDSDLFFFHDPGVLLDERADASIMIVRHAFAPWCEQWASYEGVYNGGWVTFANDERAHEALAWWRVRCLEWCYDRRENGKFADQKYIEQWPRRFPPVHVLGHPGAGVAPWNMARYTLTADGTCPCVDRQPVVFYHHSSLELFPRSPRTHLLCWLSRRFHPVTDPIPLVWRIGAVYELDPHEEALIWTPYVRQLGHAIEEILTVRPGYKRHWSSLDSRKDVRSVVARLTRRVLPTRAHSAIRRVLRRRAA